MAMLQRADVRAPVLPKETVDVPELGGEVVVCGLLLDPLLKRNGLSGGALVLHTLAAAVVLEDGAPLFTYEQWDVWAAQHPEAAIRLFDVAQRLNGLNAQANAKN